MKDFFISYNKADRGWAEWIGWQLEEVGYSVILQAWDFRPGGNFVLDMQRAAAESARTIAVLSPDYLDSRFTQPEWAAAFAQDPTGAQGLLLPVRVRACEPRGLLPQIVYIDLVGLSEDAAEERLLAGVKRERAKPKTEPRFPGAAPAPRTIAERPRFPNALPLIWNVPHNRNLNFTGRAELLAQIEAALRSGTPAALTQALSGLGGVGKTQLAVEYAYRHAAEYDLVWWMRSEQPTTLAADYAGLAHALNLPERDAAEQVVTIEAVRRWLERRGRWLLIFDNANEPPDVQPYRPRGGGGHVLITSRNQSWRGVAQPLSVTKLPRDQAIAFLLKRTGQNDEAAAAKLADALGDLPLALEQAGAYIDETGRSLASYLQLFQTHQKQLLARGKPHEYPATVATTWDLAFQQLPPAAADLLYVCAFLAPDDIPLNILTEGANYLPELLAATVTDELALDDAVAALLRYSLVERRDDMLSVHRMVQAVTRDRLDEEGRKLWAGAAVKVVNAAFPYHSDDVRTWAVCALLLPHTLLCTSYAGQALMTEEPLGRLLNQTGVYLRGRADFQGARAVYERALRIGEQVYGSEHPIVATIVNNIGSVLWALGDLQGARAAFEQALRISEQVYGLEHPTVAIRVNNLGTVLHDVGDLAEAHMAFKRALQIDEQTYGPDHPTVATDVNNLGTVLRNLGDLDGARAAYERALRIDEQVYGLEHPEVATDVSNLGSVLRALGDLAGAQAAYERALRIHEQAYGLDHPAVATDVNNLGNVLQDLGDFDGARASFERALRICRKFLGDDHANTRIVQSNLEAVIRQQQGEQ
jgi:tetratricopeptide (TPR) repeat protein